MKGGRSEGGCARAACTGTAARVYQVRAAIPWRTMCLPPPRKTTNNVSNVANQTFTFRFEGSGSRASTAFGPAIRCSSGSSPPPPASSRPRPRPPSGRSPTSSPPPPPAGTASTPTWCNAVIAVEPGYRAPAQIARHPGPDAVDAGYAARPRRLRGLRPEAERRRRRRLPAPRLTDEFGDRSRPGRLQRRAPPTAATSRLWNASGCHPGPRNGSMGRALPQKHDPPLDPAKRRLAGKCSAQGQRSPRPKVTASKG